MTGAGGRQYSGGPHGGVAPGNNEFAGGSRTPAANPVGVGGAFTSVGATGGPPPSFGTPSTAFARNDRGSNIRIPYARVVSMHSKDQLPVEDSGLTGTGRNSAYEYDGLEPAELAWIMSKQFSLKRSVDGTNASGIVAGFQPIASAIDVSAFGSNAERLDEVANLVVGGVPRFGLRGDDGAVITASAGMGGSGVNRMERMAYTRWVEAHFKHRVGRQAINLVAATISQETAGALGNDMTTTDNYNAALDSEIAYWSRCWQYSNADGLNQVGPAGGASLFAVPDIAYALQQTKPGRPLQVGVPMMQGLYCMEKGPFLRSYGVEHESVICEMDNALLGRSGGMQLVDVDRHMGSELAQRALLCELKKAGLLNWTPDGICLSKEDSGTENNNFDAFFDSRMGQLFNIAVQGPTVTKTWSSLGQAEGINASNSDIQAMPMDKVFILMVAELSYEVEDGADAIVAKAAELTKLVADQKFKPITVNDAPARPKDQFDQRRGKMHASVAAGGITESIKAKRAVDNPDPEGEAMQEALDERERVAVEMQNAVRTRAGAALTGDSTELFKLYDATMDAIAKAERPPANSTVAQQLALKARAKTAVAALEAAVGPARRAEVASDEFKATAAKLRNGTASVKKAQLMNFRLMRATSSYLSNKSHFKPGDPQSRCGLKIGYCHDGEAASAGLGALADVAGVSADIQLCKPLSGNAEYIVGGWCIGNVVDSAASRALGHNGIRSAPTTYALNVNVNVEWWNADKLYAHYQDKERDADGAPAEGTTYSRATQPYRTPEQVAKEKGIDIDQALELIRYGAIRQPKTDDRPIGEIITGDNEGVYKQPNPHGADADPNKIGQTGRDGYAIVRDAADATDSRVWLAAGSSSSDVTDNIAEHAALTGFVL
tara:strand:+ start:6490 stop:9162 length:2673 start_codon:yes stop_codon:yes gene_type:complete